MVHCVRTGEPEYRPLVWHHHDDRDALGMDDEIYFGRHLLLAPVVKEGAKEREAYLPDGQWVDFWSGKEHTGRRRIIAGAPFFEPAGLPAFVRKGAVIPIRPLCQYNQDEPDKEIMLHIFPDQKGAERIWDGEGLSFGVKYEMRDGKMKVGVGNPCSFARKIHVIPHLVAVRDGVVDSEVTFPFDSRKFLTQIIPPGSEAGFFFSLGDK